MLTLPLCVWLKKTIPGVELIYLGKNYTKPVVDCFSVIDEFVDWNRIEGLPTSQCVEALQGLNASAIIHVFPNKDIARLAKKAKIPMRIGTSHRTYHLLTCSHRLNFTRKSSPLHESQLNFELLRPFGLTEIPSLETISEMVSAFVPVKVDLPKRIDKLLSTALKTVVLHPKSQGSAVEWPMQAYAELAIKLVEKGYTVFFTGTEKEGELYRKELPTNPSIIDLSGTMTLEQLIVFIGKVQNLVACSTGPLHIAGFLGVRTIGLFSPRKPIHPGRWQALGSSVSILVNDPACLRCMKKKVCTCIQSISVERVLAEIV
jgi:ADP-heptose:LPS heptosyltransferase